MFDSQFFLKVVQEGALSQAVLDEALKEAVQAKKPLFDLLVEKNLVPEEKLVKILANSQGVIFLEKITESMVDPTFLLRAPFKFLRQNTVIPVLFNSKIFLLAAHPKDLQALDDLSLLLPGPFQQAFAPRQVINDAINRYYPFDAGKEAIDELKEEDDQEFDIEDIREQDLLEMSDDAPIVKLVHHIILQAIKEGASDVHIEPFEKELRVRYRIDGIMHQKLSPPKRYLSAIVSRVKIMANLNIAEKRIPQDGRIQIKVAEKPIDLRISVLPCNFGERIVMRILDKSKGVAELESINLGPRDFKVISKMIERPNGIVLVSGPTGSGKTTTLYSILSRLNDESSNIITVEDPVEYTIAGINQVQVNIKTGLTFSSALRSILRQDPDIALIGEIRDGETAKIATQAALTGHLVLSTIHTNSAPATISRLIDMDIEPFLIASSLICVIAQRLVRSLCQDCKAPYNPEPEFLEKFSIEPSELKNKTFYKAVGCDSCFKTGYKGRIAIFEVMEITDQISTLIVKRADSVEIKKAAISQGMKSLSSDGISKAGQGLTTLDEVFSVAFSDS